jgi:hypothetical protein
MLDHIDHLMFAASDLESGMDKVEELLGVRPAPGGQHQGFGTHNALLALGEKVYLEVIAPDPELEPPARGLLPDFLEPEPHLVTWIIRSGEIETLSRELTEAGYPTGKVYPGRRETPDGTIIKWKLTDPYAMPLGGAVPFLIDWGSSPHPCEQAPLGGKLSGLRIEHPDPASVDEAMDVLSVKMDVRQAPNFNLVATIETPNGPVELR